MRIALLLLAAVALLAACPRQEPQTRSDAGPDPLAKADEGLALFGSDAELIAEALTCELPDERRFAMLAISGYELHGFEEQLHALAADDAVAAAVLGAVYQETHPLPDFYAGRPPGQRIGPVLGAAYGLGCAARIPSASWAYILDDAAETEMGELLWGLAQLDVEPGGPLARSAGLAEALATEYAHAVELNDVDRLAALDSLLGGEDGHGIDWERYVAHLPESHWNAVQWAALLRWADRELWIRVLGLEGVHEAIQLELAKALVLVGPADVALPGGEARLTTIGMGREWRAVEFMNGRTDTMPLPELEDLTAEPDTGAPNVDDEAAYRQQAYNLALGDALLLLDYALIRGDERFVDRLVGAIPELPDSARNGVLATIMRRRPAALSDEQLEALIALEDRGVGYFLLLGWHDREVVLDSRVYALVRSSPGHENALIAAGFDVWREQQGL